MHDMGLVHQNLTASALTSEQLVGGILEQVEGRLLPEAYWL